jgi:HAD superfamily hydrolase (TIGR01509 family)
VIKAAIFDMDGTIADSEKIVWRVTRAFFKERGITLTPEEEKTMYGLTWKDFVKEILVSRGFEYKQSIKNTLKERYVRNLKKDVQPLPGIHNFLEIVRANFKTALATNSRLREVDIIFDKLDFGKYFDFKVAKNHVKSGKPSPEIYFKAASLLKVQPRECVVFEDSIVGIQAAKSAGMKCVALINTYAAEDLKHADMLIKNYADINIEHIKKIGN